MVSLSENQVNFRYAIINEKLGQIWGTLINGGNAAERSYGSMQRVGQLRVINAHISKMINGMSCFDHKLSN